MGEKMICLPSQTLSPLLQAYTYGTNGTKWNIATNTVFST